jgi:hypothetical protein
MGSFNFNKTKVNLKLALNRMKIQKNKKQNEIKASRKVGENDNASSFSRACISFFYCLGNCRDTAEWKGRVCQGQSGR